jgi:cyclic beta-1,2-glucan synthetase
VSGAANDAVQEPSVAPTVLEARARALAELQRNLERAARLLTQFFESPPFARPLERAQKRVSAEHLAGGALPKASEWFLDNYYLIRRVARQVEDELPRGFVRHLPQLASGAAKGRPRIEALAEALVEICGLSLDLTLLRSFVDAYQQVSALTIAELWALPTMLRAAVLKRLIRLLDELRAGSADAKRHDSTSRAVGDEKIERGAGDLGSTMEQAIRALRVLDAIDWKAFFERTNRTEAVLRTDPASVYECMDFETSDSYRKVVEALAWATGRAEEDVASLAIGLAQGNAKQERQAHVGYYLIAEGRGELEKRLGYRPIGVERLRRLVTSWPTVSYLLPLAVLTWLPLLVLARRLAVGQQDGRLAWIVAAMVFALVPASDVSVSFLQYGFARLLPPRTLPKLDFRLGLPPEMRTLVAMPTLLGRAEDVVAMLRQLELHYLSNPDDELQFALLTDDVDARVMRDSMEKQPLLDSAARGIEALNIKHGKAGRGPFHLLHRDLQWNAAEESFMGWERKRGKLEDLNRLLRGQSQTGFSLCIGDPSALLDIRFVITLDSDTQLPMGSAQRLVGALAHPLNRAVVDTETGRVITGYTIIQPRVETSPWSSRRSLFSRIFAGDVGFDIYTHASSELYQDLFGSGIYVGKGIYDIDAFMRSVHGRVPENMLVSHDLFEGVHGRAALATDIVLFEGYPSNYATYAMRMHRWLRGDWQLFPWLFRTVPSPFGKRLGNKLAPIDRWKIADNLRRSLTSIALLLLLTLGFLSLPGSPNFWTLGLLALFLAPLFPALASGGRRRLETLARYGLAVAFLAYESSIAVDAITRVFVRKTFTGKHLLQWTSADDAAFRVAALSPRRVFWRSMIWSPVVAVSLALLIAWLRPSAFFGAAPLLLLWLLAPEIARWISEVPRSRAAHVTDAERRRLRLLARRTWQFFDAFVGPSDQWLPVDNYQEEPREQTAHRTSPTNIGLMLISTLSAYDFGYIGPSQLSLRVRRAFDSISRLPHYQGHLLNWYDTKNLQPLLPRYVSTVDSGNWAGCLLTLKQGCQEMTSSAVVRVAAWDGLRDSIDLLEEVVESLPDGALAALRSVIARMQAATSRARGNLDDAYPILCVLCDKTSPELARELLALLEAGTQRHEADFLRALRTSIDRLQQQLQQMRREFEALVPWLALGEDAAAHGIDLPMGPRLDQIPSNAQSLLADLEAREEQRRQRGEVSAALETSAARLREAFQNARANATALVTELVALAARADEEVRGMDFKLLYDRERRLFCIGYNVTTDQVDPHYYDLLASEARLASYVAILKRDVPESHWYALGRPMTRIAGRAALLSWGGTMFEYLMPGLLMRSQNGTLLEQTNAAVVDAQIAYAKQQKEPWGISESAYARVDAEQTYQYRSFGVPGLGFKRGLEADSVVAPYASLLAVSIRPREVLANLTAFEALGMLGTYGLFEALDSTPERALEYAPRGQSFAIVRSYMAHHQGMSLVALGNFLNARSMVERFHADPLMATGEVLLNERAPNVAPPEWPLSEAPKLGSSADSGGPHRAPEAWPSPDTAGPQAFVLSNGYLTSLLTSSGGGGLRWRGLSLTRYEPDATRDGEGCWLYLRDEESRQIWLATSADGRTSFAMHEVAFHRRNQGISVHVEVTVAAADDVEVRHVTLHNETNRARCLTVTSAARPVLLDARQAPSHPAFSSMFVESESVAELDGLLFARRAQTVEEEPVVLVHRLVREGAAVVFAGYETDRGQFFGRGGSMQAPLSLLANGSELSGRVGTVIDPVMSLMARVALPPKGSVTLAFVTAVARSRTAVVDLARKYGSMHAVRWSFRDAEQETPRRLRRAKLAPDLLPMVQRLFSALLFVEPAFRAAPQVPPLPLPSQHRLWGKGISGDDPIVLVRVHDSEAPLLRETLAAQRYLRSCGVALDLVLIDEAASGYVTEGAGTLRGVLVKNDADDWLNRHGGVFVVAADQVSSAELGHLEACARVVLDTRDGSLAARFARPSEGSPKLPRFEPTLVAEPNERPCTRPPLLFDNGMGGFSADGREYVIGVSPEKVPPAPWCNVLANAEFGCAVSESSLGYSWSLNAGENRLTPWRNDPVLDTPSEALYLRDEETAAVWSPTPLPAGQSGYTLVRHGAGYTTYERESHGLIQKLTVFVPPGASLKVVLLRVKNTLGRHRRLTATYYAEWVLGSRREAQRPYIVSEFDRDQACLLATCDWNAEFAGRVAFLASKSKAHGFTADRREFLGRRGDYARPEALDRWGLSGRTDPGADPCAALQVHLDLEPGEVLETHFVLGQSADREQALQLVARFREGAAVAAAWQSLREFWEDILGNIQVKTPEPAMDLLLNRWLLYQVLSSRVFGRTGFYQSSGAFGYRDQLQDVLALLHAAPWLARAHILDAAKRQFEAGDVLHWWHPPSGRGVRTRCSDDLAWLPYVTAEYLAATGDAGILDEPVTFLEGEPLRTDEHDRYAQYPPSATSASLFEHCRRAIEHALTEGAHGLPLMGDGDWNDGMNRVGAEGRGESVWLGWFLCAAMDRFATLSELRQGSAEAIKWRARAHSLREKIKSVAWDGGWYLRAFHDDGSLVGSATSRECCIDSIAQTWAVLSDGDEKGESSDSKTLAAVRAADDQLVREKDRLVLLFWPPFDSALHDPGYIRAYPPGVRENGGQYTHAATWLGFAHAGLGDGERAERIFRLLNPVLRTRTSEESTRYRVEPYVLAGDIYSSEPWVGRGGWTWYTGAAAWLWRLGAQAILGLEQQGGQLFIDPVIPPTWDGFEAWVRVGKGTVHIVVENPDHVAGGVFSVTVDGVILHSNRVVTDPKQIATYEVQVRLGAGQPAT